MKGGQVTQIRVNPKDCLGILDIMESLEINPYDGRSFASCVSVALSSLIGVARKSGIIKSEEEENGFQFLNRMGPLMNPVKTNNKKKKMISDSLYDRARHGLSAPELPIGFIEDSEKGKELGGYKGGRGTEGIECLADGVTREDIEVEYARLHELVGLPNASAEDCLKYHELGKMLGYE